MTPDPLDDSLIDDDIKAETGSDGESSDSNPEGEDAKTTGPAARAGQATRDLVSNIGRRIETFLVNFSGPNPGGLTAKFWSGMLRASLKGMRKSTNADAINWTYLGNGRVKPLPIANTSRDGGENLWKSKDGNHQWIPSASGNEIALGPGGVPVTFSSTDANVLNDELTARMDQALALGDDWPLVHQGTVNAFFVEEDASNPKQAVADGGATRQLTNISFDQIPERLPEVEAALDDHLIDLSRTDHRVMSWDGYVGSQIERMPSEEHENAEFRGRMAEKDQDYGKMAMKLLLIAGAIVVLSLAAVFVVPKLLGGGGGGGGGGGLFGGMTLMIKPAVGGLLGV
ncbi:hypothetical protein ELS19_06140 [Halogeometricum borinquense]|uniref:Uncharacterized protein n=1 Tax=Halogeometricum borinquense TaxID=60847 RepID=A0A482TBG2_9EURY|nr:hypothetical protein [Halogeometricum borinquense]RYJ13576.1 hypothetical protein ELS19_06140 [Halogeometricum borinquense]